MRGTPAGAVREPKSAPQSGSCGVRRRYFASQLAAIIRTAVTRRCEADDIDPLPAGALGAGIAPERLESAGVPVISTLWPT